MKKIEKVLDTTMRFLMALSMAVLVIFGTWQIIARWTGIKATFTDELLRIVLIVAALLGSGYCFYRDEHLALELVTDRAKGPFKVFLTVFIEACILFFVGYVFIYGGFKQAFTATNNTEVMHIPYKYLYLTEPVAGIFIVIARILKYAQMIAEKGGKTV